MELACNTPQVLNVIKLNYNNLKYNYEKKAMALNEIWVRKIRNF